MVSKKFLAGIVAIVAAASVHATPISLSTSMSPGSQVANGQTKDFQIDVNSLLAANGLSKNSILSGFLTVTGYSAANYAFVDTSSSGYVQAPNASHIYKDCNNKGVCTDKTVFDKVRIKDLTNEFSDPVADIMKVSAGDASGSDTASDTHNSYTDWTDSVLEDDKTTGNPQSGYNYFYHRTRDHHQSIFGGLDVLLDLDEVALNDLFADGILNMSIKSTIGQFTITNIRLDFLAEEPAPAQGTVPVPTSLLLTGLGLAALATMRRRKA